MIAQNLFVSLINSFPDCIIDVLAPAWSLPLLKRMPEVAKGTSMPLNHGEFGLKLRLQLGKQACKKHYDQAIALPNGQKGSTCFIQTDTPAIPKI